jgi:hypothetical protein
MPERFPELRVAQDRFVGHMENVRSYQQTLQATQHTTSQVASDTPSLPATFGAVNPVILATTSNHQTQFDFNPGRSEPDQAHPARSNTSGCFTKAMQELDTGYVSQQLHSTLGIPQSSSGPLSMSFADDHGPQNQYQQPPGWLGDGMQNWSQ